jgi:hypothetical protein
MLKYVMRSIIRHHARLLVTTWECPEAGFLGPLRRNLERSGREPYPWKGLDLHEELWPQEEIARHTEIC